MSNTAPTPNNEALAALVLELADAVDNAANDIGGSRPQLDILRDAVKVASALSAEPKAQTQAAALERLTRWARVVAGGPTGFSGDHPIADAERALGWRK